MSLHLREPSTIEEHFFGALIGALVGVPAALLVWLGVGPLLGLGGGWSLALYGVIVAAAFIAPARFGNMLARILRFATRVFPS